MRPICVTCQRFFRCKKNDYFFIEGMPQGEQWQPYKLWAGDLYECEGCGATIISGVARCPIREHYQQDFEQVRSRLNATLQINGNAASGNGGKAPAPADLLHSCKLALDSITNATGLWTNPQLGKLLSAAITKAESQ